MTNNIDALPKFGGGYDFDEAVIGLFAYDTGAIDSGIRDESLRLEVSQFLKACTADEYRLAVSRLIRDNFLTEEALAVGYGWEDIVEFAGWMEDYL